MGAYFHAAQHGRDDLFDGLSASRLSSSGRKARDAAAHEPESETRERLQEQSLRIEAGGFQVMGVLLRRQVISRAAKAIQRYVELNPPHNWPPEK